MLNLKRLRALFLCLFALSSTACQYANAQEIKVDFGITHYIAAPCGNWYQCTPSTPYTLRLTSLSGSIGIYTNQSAGGWQVGIGYGNNRRVTSDAMIHDIDDCTVNCGPLSHMQGQGTDPYIFFDVRKNWGAWFAAGTLYVSRMNYENTNFDWYGGPNYSVGPIVSHIDHQVKNTPGFGVSIGYRLTDQLSAIVKAIPTSANNSQPDALAPGGSTWYRPVQSSSIGYSMFAGIEYSF